ncbi:universal stress protein [Halodesulfovibrio marinisediminis]|uniref:Nucleotide-binding universal stress protein, UspA family n=1 Tax=Halodesulfovibrio marinisediminis DSM 17456 TaxID=1121457 RepID=A0A1N6F452_9BACT|nr:universal stress protein [Halodesulfovibrio marinisediminis]SIN90045.1 Nucleotide-binding universal stress protein, UspA family [Halodesulfovibrio marinisediminis DSM 17456]
MFFKKILVPVDGSKHALLAKRKAMGIAISMNAEIILVNVLEHIPNIIGGHAREELREEQKEEAQRIFDKYIPELKQNNVTYSTRVATGRAFDAVCRIAEDEHCDLICMGARGLSEVEGLLLGSLTSDIISHCKIPVLVVR